MRNDTLFALSRYNVRYSKRDIEKAEVVLENSEKVIYANPTFITVHTASGVELRKMGGVVFLTNKRFIAFSSLDNIVDYERINNLKAVSSSGKGSLYYIELFSESKMYRFSVEPKQINEIRVLLDSIINSEFDFDFKVEYVVEPVKKTPLKGCFKAALIMLGVIFFFGLIGSFLGSHDSSEVIEHYSEPEEGEQEEVLTERERLLTERMSYLDDIEEITWWHIDDNTIYVAFNTIPEEGVEWICNGAAFHGNIAIDFGCHIFAVNAKQYTSISELTGDWRYMYTATYRYGKKR